MTATRLLWTAAGRPRPEGACDYKGRCYWCGLPAEGLGRDRRSLPSTFYDAVGRDASLPGAEALCAACGWTLSDGVVLPESVGARLLAAALAPDSDGRVSLDLGQGAFRAIVGCPAGHPTGVVGVWERPGKIPDEHRVREAADPATTLYLGPPEPLAARVTGKFRNFHAFATEGGRWEMLTGGEKARLREILLEPPDEPWTLSIGDGQKHEAIYGEVSPPRSLGRQTVRFQGAVVFYSPQELAELIAAIEGLLLAGAGQDEVEGGLYTPRAGLPWLRALRVSGPIVAFWRGSPVFGLALYLRRPLAELKGGA